MESWRDKDGNFGFEASAKWQLRLTVVPTPKRVANRFRQLRRAREPLPIGGVGGR